MEREKRLVKVFTIISIICVFIAGVLESISFHEIWLEFDRFFWWLSGHKGFAISLILGVAGSSLVLVGNSVCDYFITKRNTENDIRKLYIDCIHKLKEMKRIVSYEECLDCAARFWQIHEEAERLSRFYNVYLKKCRKNVVYQEILANIAVRTIELQLNFERTAIEEQYRKVVELEREFKNVNEKKVFLNQKRRSKDEIVQDLEKAYKYIEEKRKKSVPAAHEKANLELCKLESDIKKLGYDIYHYNLVKVKHDNNVQNNPS